MEQAYSNIDTTSELPMIQKRKLAFYKCNLARVDNFADGKFLRENRKLQKTKLMSEVDTIESDVYGTRAKTGGVSVQELRNFEQEQDSFF